MAMGAGRGRVAPGDAPGENRAHEPSPPRFTLVRGETLIALVPDDEESASSLVVTREGPGRLRLESREKARALIADAPRVSSRAVYGCAGAVRTPSGVHLLVIKRCVRVGVVRGCAVFRAAAFDAVSCAPPGALEALSLAERRDEKKCLALLTKGLDRKATALFFSGDPARYDATRSCARAAAAEQDEQPRTPWFAADHAFAWNSRCGETFLSEIFEISANADTNTQGVSLPQQQKQEEKASAFLVPLVCGSWRSARVAVAAKDEDQKKKNAASEAFAVVSVVARVARARHGVRHHCRGADAEGNVANFVETEQMCEVETKPLFFCPAEATQTQTRKKENEGENARSFFSSFVIARGSAPTRWAQPLRDARWRFPMLFLDDTGGDATELVDDGSSVTKPKTESHSEKSARAHLASFARTYGASTALDLLKRNPSSSESRLSASFAAAVAAAGTHVKLVSFDLAREIKMHGDREAIARLLRVTEKDAERHGFWFDSTPAPPLSRKTSTTETFTEKKHAQTGAFRVNCKDCLDRTNVAQAALAFRALNAQLRVNGFRPKTALSHEGSRALRKTHGALWSAHGDDVARLYARTRALRRDVVGSGRRSVLGALADARVAVTRWWQSKFSDGRAQDAARYFTSGGNAFAATNANAPSQGSRGFFSCLRLNQPEVVHADDAWALEVPRVARKRGGSKTRVAPAPAPAEAGGDEGR